MRRPSDNKSQHCTLPRPIPPQHRAKQGIAGSEADVNVVAEMLISGVVSKKYALNAFRTAVKNSNGGEEGVPPTIEPPSTPDAPSALVLVPSSAAQTSDIELMPLTPRVERTHDLPSDQLGGPDGRRDVGGPDADLRHRVERTWKATGQDSRAVVWKVDLGGGDLHSLCAAAQAVLERNFVSEAPSEYVEAGSRYEVDWKRWEQVSSCAYSGFG